MPVVVVVIKTHPLEPHALSRYVLDSNYTVQQLDPDTKTMKPLFAVPQGPMETVYRSGRKCSCATL